MRESIGALCTIQWDHTSTQFDGVIERACVVVGNDEDEIEENSRYIEELHPEVIGDTDLIFIPVHRLSWMIARYGQFIGTKTGGWHITNTEHMHTIYKEES